MTSFAGSFINRIMLPQGARSERPASRPEPFALRAMPNEDIHLFVKRFDNSYVVRTEDKQATKACWKQLGMASLGVIIAVGTVVPAASSKLTGYQIERRREEQSRLKKQLAQAEAVEAQLLSPVEMARMAEYQEFVDPAPEAMVVLNVDRSTALAMNK